MDNELKASIDNEVRANRLSSLKRSEGWSIVEDYIQSKIAKYSDITKVKLGESEYTDILNIKERQTRVDCYKKLLAFISMGIQGGKLAEEKKVKK